MRRAVAYLAVVLLAAAVYSGWTVYSRWNANREAEQSRQAAQIEADKHTLNALGGDQLKILSFYFEPAVVKRGERGLVCFGVSNAKTVTIEPHIDDLTPTLNRCLEIHPKRTTEYKLTATDAAGHSVAQSFVLQVK